MIYKKTNPTGVDYPIQKAQKKLHDSLNAKWGVDLDAYGRAYLLRRGDIVVPEVFVEDKDYKDVLGYDTNRFFFTVGNTFSKYSQNWYETSVTIYFILKIKDIKPLVSHRADQEVQDDVDLVLRKTDLVIESIETGIDNVLSDFNISDRDNFRYADFEPYHTFKVNCNVRYNLKTTNCNV